jgi:hypothetical protein
MKLVPIAATAALLTLLTMSSTAHAQPKAPSSSSPPPASKTTTTADYTETNTAGDQVVKFTGDELVGPLGSPYGDVIRRPPGVTRLGLIRPRLNFVPELLKSVENL